MKKTMKELKNIFSLLGKDKWKCFLAIFLIFTGSMMDVLTGYLQGQVIEAITILNIKKSLLFLGYYFLVLFVFDNLFLSYGKMLGSKIEAKLSSKISNMMYRKVLELPSYAFEDRTTGEFINRVTVDTEILTGSFENIIQIITNILACVIIWPYIFVNSYIVSLEIILFLLLIAIATKYFTPKIKKINEELKVESDKYSGATIESLRGIREIKTLGIKSNLSKEIEKIREIILEKKYKDISIDRMYWMVMFTIRLFMEITVYATCLFEIYRGNTTLGFFVAMTWYIYRYTWLVDGITDINRLLQRLFVSIRRINEIIDNKLYEDEKFGNINLKKIDGNITFDNVTFAYKNEKDTLKNFKARFETGKKIAIVGKSGQGKTTLFNLLTRIFDTEKGNIYIDDTNISDLTEECLRKNIAVIRQEPFLFHKTIKENFKMVKPNITLSEIKKYCKMAYLDKYIESLPKKYNTLLGEGGINLSGGQKQRLAIARALAKETKIILFDEATSSLDNESQLYIKKVIDKLVLDHTIIVIAHRLSTIVDSDIIYVIDKGKLVGCGTHKELLKNNKIYNTLYNSDEL